MELLEFVNEKGDLTGKYKEKKKYPVPNKKTKQIDTKDPI